MRDFFFFLSKFNCGGSTANLRLSVGLITLNREHGWASSKPKLIYSGPNTVSARCWFVFFSFKLNKMSYLSMSYHEGTLFLIRP